VLRAGADEAATHFKSRRTLLPDCRIFGQIRYLIQVLTIFYGSIKLEAVKWQNFSISGRKQAGNIFKIL
jgi:hypothetical protein